VDIFKWAACLKNEKSMQKEKKRREEEKKRKEKKNYASSKKLLTSINEKGHLGRKCSQRN